MRQADLETEGRQGIQSAMMRESLQVALKEWPVICRALETGRQMVLLRKGGIYEADGEFEIEHSRFFLFPSWLHQKLEQIKPEDRGLAGPVEQNPAHIRFTAVGEITDILPLHRRNQMDPIDDEHIWLPPLIDLRFNYRPENPLYLLIVRAYRLARAIEIDNALDYAGCKSWAPLNQPLPTSPSTPVLEHAVFESRRQKIIARIESSGH